MCPKLLKNTWGPQSESSGWFRKSLIIYYWKLSKVLLKESINQQKIIILLEKRNVLNDNDISFHFLINKIAAKVLKLNLEIELSNVYLIHRVNREDLLFHHMLCTINHRHLSLANKRKSKTRHHLLQIIFNSIKQKAYSG